MYFFLCMYPEKHVTSKHITAKHERWTKTHELVLDTRRGFYRTHASCSFPSCPTVICHPSKTEKQPRLGKTPPPNEHHAEGGGKAVPTAVPVPNHSPSVGLTSRSPDSGTSRDGKQQQQQQRPQQTRGVRGTLFKRNKSGGRATGAGAR